MPFDFFTAKKIDSEERKKTEKYIKKFRDKELRELLDRDNFNNFLICPLCRKGFPDYTYFLRHFRFYKQRWEMRLLERIYEHGPKQLSVFDVFYEKDGWDYELADKVRFWVLALKIFEALHIMPYWKTTTELNTKSYIDRIFWEKDKRAKGK
jgi:hypothetical protein